MNIARGVALLVAVSVTALAVIGLGLAGMAGALYGAFLLLGLAFG